jgi:hypothetical protein
MSITVEAIRATQAEIDTAISILQFRGWKLTLEAVGEMLYKHTSTHRLTATPERIKERIEALSPMTWGRCPAQPWNITPGLVHQEIEA